MVHSNVWKLEQIWLSGTLIIIRKPEVWRTDERMDERTDERMDERTDERTSGSLYTPDSRRAGE